jgi:hypothetical protein
MAHRVWNMRRPNFSALPAVDAGCALIVTLSAPTAASTKQVRNTVKSPLLTAAYAYPRSLLCMAACGNRRAISGQVAEESNLKLESAVDGSATVES